MKWSMNLLVVVLVCFIGGCAAGKLQSKYNISYENEKSFESTEKLLDAIEDPDDQIRLRALRCLHIIRKKNPAFNEKYEDVFINKVCFIVENDKNPNIRGYAAAVLGSANSSNMKDGAFIVNVDDDSDERIVDVLVAPEFVFWAGERRFNAVHHGVLPLKLSIQNRTMHNLSLQMNNITLKKKSGTTFDKLTAEEAIHRMQYSIGKSVTKAILFGPLAWASPGRAARANRLISNTIQGNKLENVEIGPHSQVEGYLFFDAPKTLRHIYANDLELMLIDIDSGDLYEVASSLGKETTTNVIRNKKSIVVEKDKSFEEKLNALKSLFDKGLIESEEYMQLRKSLIACEVDPSACTK